MNLFKNVNYFLHSREHSLLVRELLTSDNFLPDSECPGFTDVKQSIQDPMQLSMHSV